jgi:hypothetical protein
MFAEKNSRNFLISHYGETFNMLAWKEGRAKGWKGGREGGRGQCWGNKG